MEIYSVWGQCESEENINLYTGLFAECFMDIHKQLYI